jgi:hypothetical protein
VSIASKEGIANSLGDVWINAIAALDTPRAREILMSFIDPESPEVTGTLKTGREDVLLRRIAELAGKYPTIRSRILDLCQVSLDRAKRNLLASVIAQLGDSESLLQALYLLDDELSPELPYDLGKAVEEMARSDPRRKVSALALLSRIESWRREYGRPVGETRNPIFGS